jgi:cytochrome oxidase Cu insertion factor (SCO1/SenC/PrrC family)
MISRFLFSRWAFGASLAASASLVGLLWSARPAADGPLGGEPSCCAIDAPGTDLPDDVTPAPSPALAAKADDGLFKPPTIPDVTLLDQHGRTVRFYTDLVKGRVVAINFMFTRCQTICPALGVNFGQLQSLLDGRPIQLISVSLDPLNDRPAQLAEWAKRYGAGPNWTLVTGEKPEVDALLKALGAYTADKSSHSPLILLGDDNSRTWRRLNGFTAPETVGREILSLARAGRDAPSTSASPDDDARGRRYFTDVPLVNQYGETMRFYSDLLRGKVVVIHVFFSKCSNTCPLMLATYQKLQDHLGDRLGRDVHLISLTVDPENDGWEALRDHAARLGVRRGWYFLTGSSEDVGLALRKLGMAVARREEHSNLFIVGNEPTGLWKKVQGLAPADQIIPILDGVVADQGDVGKAGGD